MKYAITILTVFTFISCNSQTMKVTYTEKMDLTEKLKSIDNPMIKQMIIEKTGGAKYYELISQNGSSIYQMQSEEESIENGVTMIGGGGEDIVYKNHNDKTYIKQTDFMSRLFLIEDKLKVNDWNVTDESAKIGEYSCKKALLKKGEKDIVAWFTDEIPSNEGPREYHGLPGLVLKVETGTVIIEASDISLSNDKVTLEVPTKGKKVTRDEFEEIRNEKINSLTGQKQRGNGVKIIKM